MNHDDGRLKTSHIPGGLTREIRYVAGVAHVEELNRPRDVPWRQVDPLNPMRPGQHVHQWPTDLTEADHKVHSGSTRVTEHRVQDSPPPQ